MFFLHGVEANHVPAMLQLAWVPFIGDLSEAVTSGLVASRDDPNLNEEHAYGMSLYRGRGKYPDGRLPG